MIEKKIIMPLVMAMLVMSPSLALDCSAQSKPQIKVDISITNRGDDETLESGYTLWRPKQSANTDTLNIDGVKFSFHVPDGTTAYVCRSNWNKNYMQDPTYKANNGRLTFDGISLDPQTVCGQLDLVIEGLPKGTHTLQTYHNRWSNPATNNGWPMFIKVNGELVHSRIEPTFLQDIAANACLVTTSFNVANDGDKVVVSFYTIEEEPPVDISKTTNNKAPVINGFELNTVSVTAQAKAPTPTSGNLHLDADDGNYTLSWSPANSSVAKHNLYFGTDSAVVANMTEPTAVKEYADTTYTVTELYSMNTYYWRVDEVASDGTVTTGNIWSFRPRHLAFPGAEGYGRFAYGGRGGYVYHVTNLLDDHNPGSFRYGVQDLTGARTIVFDVGGYIPLTGTLSVNSNEITIAGQTAPGKGICFGRKDDTVASAAMGFGGKDIIVRYIRNRVGAGETCDGMGMRGADHSIMDHCSMSWSIDEGFSCRESYNLTFQHSIIAEALNVAGHDHYDAGSAHGFAAVFGGDISSIHHNLLSNNSGRNPRLDGGMEGDGTYKGRVDYFNNVVYNWNAHPSYGEAHEANFHSNYYKMGPATTRQWILIADVNQRGSNKGTESYYFMNNVLAYKNGSIKYDGTKHNDAGTDGSVDGGSWKLTNPMDLTWDTWVEKPFFPSYANVTNAYTAYKDVLSDCGCNLPEMDKIDLRQVRTTREGTSECKGGTSGLLGLIDSEADCGGRDEYPETHREASFDTDQDGLPDWWETMYGTSPDSPANDYTDANSDTDHDGYTLLEDYLNYMATPHFDATAGAVTVNLADYFYGYTKNPRFTVAASTQNIIAITGSTMTITPSASFSGIEYFDINVIDDEIPAGQTAPVASSRRFAVLVNNGLAGISNVKGSVPTDDGSHATFNIAGMRVSSAFHGIVIHNGRKLVR